MDALSVLLQNVHLFETKYYRLNGTGNWSYSNRVTSRASRRFLH